MRLCTIACSARSPLRPSHIRVHHTTLQERFIGRLSEMLLDSRCTQEIRRIWGAASTAYDDILCNPCAARRLQLRDHVHAYALVHLYVSALT